MFTVQEYNLDQTLRADQSPEEIVELIRNTLATKKPAKESLEVCLNAEFYRGQENGSESYCRGAHSLSNDFEERLTDANVRALWTVVNPITLPQLMDLPQFDGTTTRSYLDWSVPASVQWIAAATTPVHTVRRANLVTTYPGLINAVFPDSVLNRTNIEDEESLRSPADLKAFSTAVDSDAPLPDLLALATPNHYLKDDQIEAFCKSDFDWPYLQRAKPAAEKRDLLGTLFFRLGGMEPQSFPTDSDGWENAMRNKSRMGLARHQRGMNGSLLKL